MIMAREEKGFSLYPSWVYVVPAVGDACGVCMHQMRVADRRVGCIVCGVLMHTECGQHKYFRWCSDCSESD